jgi:DNA-binding response OmpR family regulator
VPSSSPSPVPVRPRGSEHLLLLEDDAQVRELTVRVLKAAGYEVQTPADPQAALDLPQVELDGVRLLITDVVMPGHVGREVAEALRLRCHGLRVLYVSGHTHETLAERGALDAGSDFLAKPYTGPSLLARVRAALDVEAPRADPQADGHGASARSSGRFAVVPAPPPV